MKNLLGALLLGSLLAAAAHAQKPRTDRQNEGLKGPVKSIVVESAELKKQGGQYVEGPRSLQARATYDAEGNRTNDEEYIDGELWTKREYRYVGGVAVADIHQKYVLGVIPSSAATPDPKPAPPTKPPPMRRFTEKYRGKYDAAGNAVELVIEEDGRVRNRLTYRREGGRKETRGYVEQGSEKLHYRVVETFDAGGNLVGVEDITGTGHVLQKSTYGDYKFDERGNWIKRLVSDWADEGGKPRFEPARVEYRTITYF